VFFFFILPRTALARFRQAQLEEGKVKERRPFLASECTELPKAEKWRRQIIGEISKKVAQIQNAGLGEFRIRDLNDEINKLLREKGHWEVRIKELGGPDYGVKWDPGCVCCWHCPVLFSSCFILPFLENVILFI
uniref:Pre-mRNA-splicing factor ISY1 homolog n=1 Tax=Spermophilus dauricus TaxID=99837 RepID=A0A8C9P9C0_SPEDA